MFWHYKVQAEHTFTNLLLPWKLLKKNMCFVPSYKSLKWCNYRDFCNFKRSCGATFLDLLFFMRAINLSCEYFCLGKKIDFLFSLAPRPVFFLAHKNNWCYGVVFQAQNFATHAATELYRANAYDVKSWWANQPCSFNVWLLFRYRLQVAAISQLLASQHPS